MNELKENKLEKQTQTSGEIINDIAISTLFCTLPAGTVMGGSMAYLMDEKFKNVMNFYAQNILGYFF
jgi:hypothetical protein